MMLQDFITLSLHSITSSIAWPTVEAHNFKLKLALMSMVQQAQFGGTAMEDLNLHPLVILEMCDTLKVNRVSTMPYDYNCFLFIKGQGMGMALFTTSKVDNNLE